jgi:hypothetical protein
MTSWNDEWASHIVLLLVLVIIVIVVVVVAIVVQYFCGRGFGLSRDLWRSFLVGVFYANLYVITSLLSCLRTTLREWCPAFIVTLSCCLPCLSLLLCFLYPHLFFFFLYQQFITRCSNAVRGPIIQTVRTLRLRYALPVITQPKRLRTSFWRANTGRSPRIFHYDVALSSGEKVEAPPHRPAHTVTHHRIALGRSPDRNPTQRSGQSPEGVDSP